MFQNKKHFSESDALDDCSNQFLRQYADEIQLFAEDSGLSFAEVWYIGNNDTSQIRSDISPLFSFTDDDVTRGTEKVAVLEPLREVIVKQYGGKCAYCGKAESEIAIESSPQSKRRKLELDHFLVPFSRNGQLIMGRNHFDENIPILSNCVVACPSCNSRKKDKIVTEFMKGRFDRLFEILTINAELTLKFRETFGVVEQRFDEDTTRRILLENLGIDEERIKMEFGRRYGDVTIEVSMGDEPYIIDRDIVYGRKTAIGYHFNIIWHGVDNSLDCYDLEGNLKEFNEYIKGEPSGDPFSAAKSLRDEWRKWLDENVPDDKFNDDSEDPEFE